MKTKKSIFTSFKRYQATIVANDEAKRAHKAEFDAAKEQGDVEGDYEPLLTNFDLAVRWLQNFLIKHNFDVPLLLRFIHNFLDFSGSNNHPALAKKNCAFLFGSSNSGVRKATRPDIRPISVADGWAGAEMRVFTLSNSIITDGPTDQRTKGRTKPPIELHVRN